MHAWRLATTLLTCELGRQPGCIAELWQMPSFLQFLLRMPKRIRCSRFNHTSPPRPLLACSTPSYDSYGDGWHGGQITLAAVASLASDGSPASTCTFFSTTLGGASSSAAVTLPQVSTRHGHLHVMGAVHRSMLWQVC